MRRAARLAALWTAALFALFAPQLSAEQSGGSPLPARVTLTPAGRYPHDADSFCQGLFCGGADGALFFYESAGRFGRAAL